MEKISHHKISCRTPLLSQSILKLHQQVLTPTHGKLLMYVVAAASWFPLYFFPENNICFRPHMNKNPKHLKSIKYGNILLLIAPLFLAAFFIKTHKFSLLLEHFHHGNPLYFFQTQIFNFKP